MKCVISTLCVIVLFILLTSEGFSQRQNVEIIVLPQHEENFNKLIPWLNENSLFRNKDRFIKSIRETFKYAKQKNKIMKTMFLGLMSSNLSW